MKDFKKYLKSSGEVGYVERLTHTIAHVSGLPSVRPSEVVVFETGEIGQVLSLLDETIEVLLFFKPRFAVGTQVARTNEILSINITDKVLGNTISPLDILDGGESTSRPIDTKPTGITHRTRISRPFETGVSIIDMVIPLGLGQRELIIGDRKTGKTDLLKQVVANSAKKDIICVYSAIGKRAQDIKSIENFFKTTGASPKSVIVATQAAASPGLIYLTPYVAMSIAEHFRDKGKDVLVILDDLSIHAKYYREISLLAGRFPGRSSYPGDVFYLHSRLLERAGSFKKSSITALAVAETVVSDLSGYIQTNLMAMTDGHIFYDADLYGLGRRPPINPFLSVTRVGKQTQTPLMRDITTQLTNFLVQHEKVVQYMHFGAELNEKIKASLALGQKIYLLFDQLSTEIVPLNANIYLFGRLWGGYWKDKKDNEILADFKRIKSSYATNTKFRSQVDKFIKSVETLNDLVTKLKNVKQ